MSRSSIRKNAIFVARCFFLAALAVAFLFFAGCAPAASAKKEIAYVSAAQVDLRDHLAAVYQKTGTVTNGEQVQILERSHNGRFVRVRTPQNEEGWLEVRVLAPESVFAAVQQLARENGATPVQANGTVHAQTNLHVEPARTADHLYQLQDGDKVQILKRATSPRPGSSEPLLVASSQKGAADEAPAVAYEDWWLVRDSHDHYGWVLAHMVEMDVPLEVAQYAEGQRIMANFVLNTVKDGGKQVPQYLMLLNPTEGGEPQDFNELRVFTWDAHRHRYETAFLEHKLSGMLPASVGEQDFGKEGKLPVFTVLLRDPDGKPSPSTYKLNGVMVKRVLAAGDAPPPNAERAPPPKSKTK